MKKEWKSLMKFRLVKNGGATLDGLARTFECSRQYASKALNFEVHSERARRIRNHAANREGYVLLMANQTEN